MGEQATACHMTETHRPGLRPTRGPLQHLLSLSTNLIWAFPSQLFSICAFLFFWLHRRRASWDCGASITRTLNVLIIVCLCFCNGPKYKIKLFNTWSCLQDVGSRSKVFTHKTIQTTRGKASNPGIDEGSVWQLKLKMHYFSTSLMSVFKSCESNFM